MAIKLIPKQQIGGYIIAKKIVDWLRTPKDYSDEVANTPECAEYSNSYLRKSLGKNIWGNAWTRTNNKVTKVISGYDGLTKPAEYDKKQVLNYLYQAADNVEKNIDLSKLQTGDLVGLYFKGSPNLEKAYREGANGEAQTHTGHIIVEDGVPYVVHNVHTNVIKNKAEKLLGRNRPYGIVSVYRPK